MGINEAAVAGTITSVIGYAQFCELLAAMNVESMAPNTYTKYRENIILQLKDAAIKSMAKAGQAERKIAIAERHNINGMPYIQVVGDGQWSKRSYNNHGYDALSGCAALVGAETGQVLFIGIRNKFCSFYEYYERKNLPCKPHLCFKNFDHNVSSTSMESDIIAEGFNCSIEQHGLIYKTLIADNDSSVYATIINNDPYHDYNVEVEKIDCTNHLLRNMCNKLRAIAKTTDDNFLRNREFVSLRQKIADKVKEIRDEVDKAALRRQSEDGSIMEKGEKLSHDLTVIIEHVFGKHDKCKSRGFDCNVGTEDENYIPKLEHFGLLEKIDNVMNQFSCSAESLVQHMTNNLAELFNSVICKVIAGKRIDFSKRGSYDARMYVAVLQFNSQQMLTELNKSLSFTECDVLEKLEKRRQAAVANNKTNRQTNRRSSGHRKNGTDGDYGPEARQPILSSEVLLREKASKK